MTGLFFTTIPWFILIPQSQSTMGPQRFLFPQHSALPLTHWPSCTKPLAELCWPSSMSPYGATRPYWVKAEQTTHTILSLCNFWGHDRTEVTLKLDMCAHHYLANGSAGPNTDNILLRHRTWTGHISTYKWWYMQISPPVQVCHMQEEGLYRHMWNLFRAQAYGMCHTQNS